MTRSIPSLVLLLVAPALHAQKDEKFQIDLSEGAVDQLAGEKSGQGDQTQSKPWYENVEFWGHAAAGYFDSGQTGYRPKGSFWLREALFYIRAHATEKISARLEVRFARAGLDGNGTLRTDEVYIEVREVLDDAPELLNFKLGTFDIPFGEEYARRDAIDYPTINYSAGIPYGVDEGILAYGSLGGLNYAAAVMDGTAGRSQDENGDKAVALKLFGNPTENLYLSGSAMHTGETAIAANCFAGIYLAPVGSFGKPSTKGATPSQSITVSLFEIDALYEFNDLTFLMFSLGKAQIDDEVAAFDRDLTWGFLEASLQITENTYVAARFSEIGTYDSNEGYSLNGRISGAGLDAFGWDAKRLQRIGLTFGYHPHRNLWMKTEIGRDRFWVIDGSPFRPGSDHRLFFGFEVVVGF